MKKTLKTINTVVEWLMAIFLFSTFAVCAAQVFARFFLNSSIKWSDEVCRFTFILCMLLGGIINSRDNGHTAVDIILNMVHGRSKFIYVTFVRIVSIFCCIAFAWAGLMWVEKSQTQVSAILKIPMWYLYFFTVISGVFMSINTLVNIVRDWKAQKGDAEK